MSPEIRNPKEPIRRTSGPERGWEDGVALWKVVVDGGTADYHVIARSPEEATECVLETEGGGDEGWELDAHEAPDDSPIQIRWDDNPGGLELDERNCVEMSPREWLDWFANQLGESVPFVLCCSEW